MDQLDRHAALEVLSDKLLHQLELPNELKFLGEQSELELRPLPRATEEALESTGIQMARFYLSGEASDWDWWEWPLQKRFSPNADSSIETLQIVWPKGTLEELPATTRTLFASLTESERAPSVEFIAVSPGDMRFGGGHLVTELEGRNKSVRWASSSSLNRNLNRAWGRYESDEATVVYAAEEKELDSMAGHRLNGEELRPTDGNAVVEKITTEFDGPIHNVGRTFWDVVRDTFPEYREALDSGEPIRQISYQDRYLRSPLSVAILYDVLRELDASNNLSSATLEIQTTVVDSDKDYQRYEYHDWHQRRIHESVMEKIFDSLSSTTDLTFSDVRSAEHKRSMRVEWESGLVLEIMLDQGFGFLQARQGREFPFEATPEQQARTLQDLSTRLNNAYDTSFIAIRSPQES
jgi:hypothetical protein